MNKILAALNLTSDSCALLMGGLSSGSDTKALKARCDVRTGSFRAKAKIPEISLAEFCRSFRAPSETNLRRAQALEIPVACSQADLGGPGYYLALACISAALQPKQIVEFGTYLGFAAATLAINAPETRILTIDLPDRADNLENLNATDQEHVRSSRNRVGQCYKGTSYESRITELKGDSREIVLRNHVQDADLILVDGGHDMSCVSADTKNAFAIAHSGSVILWDDYFWLYPDVVRFLDDLADTRKLVRLENTGMVGLVVE